MIGVRLHACSDAARNSTTALARATESKLTSVMHAQSCKGDARQRDDAAAAGSQLREIFERALREVSDELLGRVEAELVS